MNGVQGRSPGEGVRGGGEALQQVLHNEVGTEFNPIKMTFWKQTIFFLDQMKLISLTKKFAKLLIVINNIIIINFNWASQSETNVDYSISLIRPMEPPDYQPILSPKQMTGTIDYDSFVVASVHLDAFKINASIGLGVVVRSCAQPTQNSKLLVGLEKNYPGLFFSEVNISFLFFFPSHTVCTSNG